MFPFAATQKVPETPEVTPVAAKAVESHPLDELTGGAFSAPTSGERTARIRAWLAGAPSAEQMQAVFKELSGKDKGASKLLRERLDEIKRSRGQASLANEWAQRAGVLLALPKLNIADAMAWQRDAAKAGAPLSKEPLAALRGQLSDRVKCIEDLQHRVQVQREAAVLLAQRIEVLSTKSWRDAQTVVEALTGDVTHWQAQAALLLDDPNWPSVDSQISAPAGGFARPVARGLAGVQRSLGGRPARRRRMLPRHCRPCRSGPTNFVPVVGSQVSPRPSPSGLLSIPKSRRRPTSACVRCYRYWSRRSARAMARRALAPRLPCAMR